MALCVRTRISVVAMLALAGGTRATAFTLSQVAITPGSAIQPSTGSFVTLYAGFENYFLGGSTCMVDNVTPSFWDPSDLRPEVDCTTYLAIDPQGPDNFQGMAGSFPAPKWSANLGGTGLVISGPGLASELAAGPGGLVWYPDSPTFTGDSEPTVINGVTVDSMFIAHFVVDTPGVTLEGEDLYLTIDGVGRYVPLDGSLASGPGVPLQLGYQRMPCPDGSEMIDVFVGQTPTPGTLCVGALAALGLGRRRRR